MSLQIVLFLVLITLFSIHYRKNEINEKFQEIIYHDCFFFDSNDIQWVKILEDKKKKIVNRDKEEIDKLEIDIELAEIVPQMEKLDLSLSNRNLLLDDRSFEVEKMKLVGNPKVCCITPFAPIK